MSHTNIETGIHHIHHRARPHPSLGYLFRGDAMKKSAVIILLLIVSLLMTACGSSDEGPIEVTFTGDGCTFTGPTELPIGERSFYFKDLSGNHATFWVRRYRDGKTLQDMLDLQTYPGEYIPKQSWIASAKPVKDEWNEDVYVRTYDLEIEGEYGIHIATMYDELWFCFPFTVR